MFMSSLYITSFLGVLTNKYPPLPVPVEIPVNCLPTCQPSVEARPRRG